MVGLVLAMGLSGAPAAVAACALACLQVPGIAHDDARPSPGFPAAAPAGHEHHHAPAPAGVPGPGRAHLTSAASLHACCPDPQPLAAIAVAVVRPDTHLVPAALTTPAAWWQPRPSVFVGGRHRPSAAAPGRTRTPLVLRL